jgi:hypothetical protein
MSMTKEVVMFSFDARDRGGSREWMRAWGGDEVSNRERTDAERAERTSWEAEMAALWVTGPTERRQPSEEEGRRGGSETTSK